MTQLNEAAALVDRATSRRVALTERLAVIDRLRAAEWEPVKLLETVSRSLPDDVWLLEMRQTGTRVEVDGRAMSISSITDFAAGLQDSGMFKRPVEILTTSTETYEGRTVVWFSIRVESLPPEGEPAVTTRSGATIVPVRPSLRDPGA